MTSFVEVGLYQISSYNAAGDLIPGGPGGEGLFPLTGLTSTPTPGLVPTETIAGEKLIGTSLTQSSTNLVELNVELAGGPIADVEVRLLLLANYAAGFNVESGPSGTTIITDMETGSASTLTVERRHHHHHDHHDHHHR